MHPSRSCSSARATSCALSWITSIDIANEKAGYNGKVKLVQPIGNFPQMADWINEQEGLYTLYLRGSEKGQKVDAKRVISCVSDCVCPYVRRQVGRSAGAGPL